jgi:hypothetical protein
MDWHVEARRVLRAELVRRGTTVEELAAKLAQLEVFESPKSLAVKISRGKFQLAFFLQCMSALGAATVTISIPSKTSTKDKLTAGE